MPDTTQKNKLLFDFYQNIKNGTEILSIEDLEIAIKTMELAKEELKTREQKRIQKAELEALKNKAQNTDFYGKVLYLPKNLRRLNANAFRDNKEIVKVVINEGCVEIGEYAFEGCTNLKEIVFPKNRMILRRGCFKNCLLLKEVIIPDVSNICPQAFMNCTSLETLGLPTTVSNIYSEAFKNCFSLKQVFFNKGEFSFFWGRTFPGVFENCTSLEKIKIPNGLHLDKKTFINCKKLKEIQVYGFHKYKKFAECNAKIIKI